MQAQQGDVFLFQSLDDGNIEVIKGVVTMTGGLETAAYLALYGGNLDDDGREGNPKNWWGNLSETDPVYQYRSETQYWIQSLPFSSGNLRKIEEAAKRDLKFFLEIKAANKLDVMASIPGLNKIKLKIDIEAVGGLASFEFTENWMAAI